MLPPRLPATSLRRPFSRRHCLADGFSFIEVITAMTVTAIVGVSIIGGLIAAQRFSAATRLATNARVILKRNLDTALNVKFTSATTPDILAITAPEGEIFNALEPQTTGTNPLAIPIALDSKDKAYVSGTLKRIVTTAANPANAVILRVTFTIDYDFQGHRNTQSLSSIRSRDDQ